MDVKPKLKYSLHRAASNVEEHFVGKEIKFLSAFQIEKLTVFFNRFFDHDLDGVLRQNDIDDLVERLRIYMDWDVNNPDYVATVDLYTSFFDCLKEQVTREMGLTTVDVVPHVTKNQWLNLWGRMTPMSTSIISYPIWVQMLPKHIFQVMDKDQDGKISRNELRNFYQKFIGIKEDLDMVTDIGYRAMTGNGDYDLDYNIYSMCFTNFLLGKSEYGPGKYIFGVFGHVEYTRPFHIDYGDIAE